MAKVLVETISMMRHRYVVEAPDDHPEYALDTVTCDEAEEVSQKFLNETIVSHRILTDNEYIEMFNEDNEYLSDWTTDEKMKFITKVPE